MAPIIKRLSKELLSCWPNKKLSIMADHTVTQVERCFCYVIFKRKKKKD